MSIFTVIDKFSNNETSNSETTTKTEKDKKKYNYWNLLPKKEDTTEWVTARN